MTAMRPLSGPPVAPMTQFIPQPNRPTLPPPPKSVPLPARGRHSASGARLPPSSSGTQTTSHVVNRHSRREQRESVSVQRSAVLEDFRNNRNKRWDLKVRRSLLLLVLFLRASFYQDIEGHIVEFSGDQHGSRFIQHKLLTAQEAPRSMVYRSIIPHNVLLLAQDVFGNYVSVSRPRFNV
jgi:hypothetical protein